jgi:hypothetical protein
MAKWRFVRDWTNQQFSNLQRRFPLFATIGVVGGTLGLLGGGASLAEPFAENDTTREFLLSSTLASITIMAVVVLAWREKQLGRHSKYVETLHHQEEASELLRDLRIYLRRFGNSQVAPNPEVLARSRAMIEEVLTIYAHIFSALTSTRCRTCVKMVNVSVFHKHRMPTPDDLLVYTLARDASSQKEEQNHDKDRLTQGQDKLAENSDFLSLFDPEVRDNRFFLSNNLANESGYRTSSWNYRMKIASKRKTGGRYDEWPLWYRSTIVWPVRRARHEVLGISDPICIGFVTVDSRHTEVFSATEHAPIGQILANALYPILDQYVSLDQMIASRKRDIS